VARRRLTIKRLDPWSVLKFGAVANLALLAIFLLVMGVVWFIIERLELVDQACGIATDIGFTSCGINAGNLFQALVLLGLLWAVVQTAVFVFLAFLHNLIADLTGGLVIGIVDDTPVRTEPHPGRPVTAGTGPINARTAPPRPADQRPVSEPTPSASGRHEPVTARHEPVQGAAPRRDPDAADQGDAARTQAWSARRSTGEDDLFADR
jgi:hypothetical protein